ncbi:MAG: putative tRNA/rRNA methyltransferase [Promethearchaeota archaeon]|nr:MAG: putative tRNA/rRNA methyltransferase [Candidatus Lokiarchaeota archaeon]
MDKKEIYRDLEEFEETHRKKSFKNVSVTIVLVQPESAGNIGSIARVMKNFDFKHLVVFNPIEKKEKIFSKETQGFAMHGKDILLNAAVFQSKIQSEHLLDFKKYLNNYDLIIGTTAKGSRYTNIKRLAIFPEDLKIPISKHPIKIALLFGKESRGLTNDEMKLVDIPLRIPTSNDYPTMNLSHACAVILYELFKKLNEINIGRGEHPVLLADKKDRKLLYDKIEKLISNLKVRNYRQNRTINAFKNAIERGFLSKKELSLILGLFSKMEFIIQKFKPFEDED